MKEWFVANLRNKVFILWNNPVFGALFWPLALLVQGLALSRRLFLRRKKLPVLTIVIGNPNVGGSGKTPFVVWLVKKLEQKKLRVGVVSRGYKGFFRLRKPFVAFGAYNPLWLGDEAALIGEHCRCPVAAYHDRYRAAVALLQQHKVDVIIFDDGLQYPGIAYTMTICLYNTAFLGNGFTLPAGPLRASLTTLEGCTFLLNAQAHKAPFVKKNRPWVYHAVTKEERMLSSFLSCTLVLGLADPEPVIAFIKQYVSTLNCLVLGDHESCSIDVLTRLLTSQSVVMTEKDWVKIKNKLNKDDDLWLLPLELEVCPKIEELIVSTLLKSHRHATLERPFF